MEQAVVRTLLSVFAQDDWVMTFIVFMTILQIFAWGIVMCWLAAKSQPDVWWSCATVRYQLPLTVLQPLVNWLWSWRVYQLFLSWEDWYKFARQTTTSAAVPSPYTPWVGCVSRRALMVCLRTRWCFLLVWGTVQIALLWYGDAASTETCERVDQLHMLGVAFRTALGLTWADVVITVKHHFFNRCCYRARYVYGNW